eukprot:362167-Chlamydomonas_euryale.AAC.5
MAVVVRVRLLCRASRLKIPLTKNQSQQTTHNALLIIPAWQMTRHAARNINREQSCSPPPNTHTPQDEYKSFAALLAAPQQEAKDIIARRFPVPRLVDCDYQGSQARFLLVKLNPSSTHASTAPTSAEVINTDDVSLATFTEHLKRLAVVS